VRSSRSESFWSQGCVAATRAATLASLAFSIAGCAPLSQSVVAIGGASPAASDAVARIDIDTEHPVLLRAVDETFLSSIQVSSKLRSFTYVLHPGSHALWVSSAPYGLPLTPQRLKCFVINAKLSAGSSYTLRINVPAQTPVLAHSTGSEPQVTGSLVDEPLILERGCKWR
jgi:hypothetical protein